VPAQQTVTGRRDGTPQDHRNPAAKRPTTANDARLPRRGRAARRGQDAARHAGA
jgi:hypothetical protein